MKRRRPSSQLYLLDDLRFTALAAVNGVMPGEPILAAEGAMASGDVPMLTKGAVEILATLAAQSWDDAGLSVEQRALLSSLRFEVADLQGAALATYGNGTILIDLDAAGRGWFVDSTPAQSEEFAASATSEGQYFSITGGAAAGKYDLLTVLIHEMGHALGFADQPATVTSEIMTESIGLGMRRLPTVADLFRENDADLPAANPAPDPTLTVNLPPVPLADFAPFAAAVRPAGTPVTSALTNADFAAAEGWTTAGGGVVSGGVGVLAEDARFLSSLQQGFAVPAGADSITLRIASTNLGSNAALPPDAFEIALLDPVTGASLLGALGGLSLSDALLNLQADGSLYLAPGVTVQGNPLTGAAIVTISLAGVDTSNGAWLSFDLIGQGALDSRVTIDDVAFGGAINTPPVARDDTATVAEDGEVAIALLANDSDVDGDALAVSILTARPMARCAPRSHRAVHGRIFQMPTSAAPTASPTRSATISIRLPRPLRASP